MRKNKIRILHVAQAAGGVDRYIRMLLKYLDKEKFENIDSNKPFAIVLPISAGTITFYDVNGNTVEYWNNSL